MAGKIDARLAELGIELPEAPAPVASYVPYTVAGKLVFLSGQINIWNGELGPTGKVGVDLTIEQGQEASRLCALNLIAHLKNACGGDLDQVVQVIRLGGFVNCNPDFADQPKVIEGASALFIEVFGDAGRHARTAVCAPSLPFLAPAEVDGIFEIA